MCVYFFFFSDNLKPIAAEERRIEEEEKKAREEQERIAKQLAEGSLISLITCSNICMLLLWIIFFIFLSPHSEWRHHPEVKLLSSQDFLCAIPASASSSWSRDGEVVSRPVRHSCVWTFPLLPWILQLLSGPLSDVNLRYMIWNKAL